MRIGIDVRYLSHGLVGGVHRYITHLVPALIEAGPDHRFFLYADTKRPFELTDLPANVSLRLLNYRNGLSSIYHDFTMHRAMEADQVDVVHFPANYGFGPSRAKSVITLHDQINVLPLREIYRGHRKNLKTMGMMTYLHFCSTRAVRQASLIITVSNYSRQQILAHVNLPPEQVIALHYGPSPSLHRVEDKAILEETRTRLNISRPFVLADAIKNPGVLVRAWKLLPENLRESHQIVFFSRTPTPPEAVQEAVAAGYARLLVRPANDDLMTLYSMAEAFIFPSWIEGFGLPPVEAMTCGAPVIASDRGSIPEVVGDAALIIDAEDADGLAKHIISVLSDSALAEKMRQKGYARAATFTWGSTARQLLQHYTTICASPAHSSPVTTRQMF